MIFFYTTPAKLFARYCSKLQKARVQHVQSRGRASIRPGLIRMLKGCHQEPGLEVLTYLQARSSPSGPDDAREIGRFFERDTGEGRG